MTTETLRSASDSQAPLVAWAARLIQEYDAQGDHRTGSETDEHSAAWLADQVRAVGAEPLLEPFSLARVVPASCYLQIGGTRIDGLPGFDGGLTDADGIDGLFGPLGGDADIALVETAPNGEYDAHLMAALAEGRHRAFVIVTRGGQHGIAPVNAPRFSAPRTQPVLMVSGEDAQWLRARADARARVQVVMQAARVPSIALNVTARIPGSDPTLAPVIVMTPRSGWWNCAGERGGGLVCWLMALRALIADPPARPVLFTANSGHELGHLGLVHLLATQPALGTSAHAWIHYGANLGARGSRLRLQSADDALRRVSEEALARQDVTIEHLIGPDQEPSGEVRDIYRRQGRYLSLLGTPGPLFHHPGDRWPVGVSIDRVVRLAAAQPEIVRRVAAAVV
jgi:hypothetical protein